MEWILILFIHSGWLTPTSEVALTNVSGFSSERECVDAGEKTKILVKSTVKEVRFVCVSQNKN